MSASPVASRALALESVANLIEQDDEFFSQLLAVPGEDAERLETSQELRSHATQLRENANR